MAIITEDYVSFEIAKLLKEKGFDEICYLGYNRNGEYVPTNNRTNSQIIQPDFCFICCPTLQMAMKWLREVYGIYVVFFHTDRSGWWFNISDIKDSYVLYGSEKTKCSFEEICEAAIKYCLKELI